MKAYTIVNLFPPERGIACTDNPYRQLVDVAVPVLPGTAWKGRVYDAKPYGTSINGKIAVGPDPTTDENNVLILWTVRGGKLDDDLTNAYVLKAVHDEDGMACLAVLCPEQRIVVRVGDDLVYYLDGNLTPEPILAAALEYTDYL